MPENELVPVFTTQNSQHAEILRGALAEEGIEAYVESPLQGGLTGTLKVRLHVHAKDADRARAFIAQHEQD